MKLPSTVVDPSVRDAHVRVEFVIGDTLIVFSTAMNSNRGLMAVPSSFVCPPKANKRRGGKKKHAPRCVVAPLLTL